MTWGLQKIFFGNGLWSNRIYQLYSDKIFDENHIDLHILVKKPSPLLCETSRKTSTNMSKIWTVPIKISEYMDLVHSLDIVFPT